MSLLSAPGKYSVVVTGGIANVGHKARMSFYSGQRRGKVENLMYTLNYIINSIRSM